MAPATLQDAERTETDRPRRSRGAPTGRVVIRLGGTRVRPNHRGEPETVEATAEAAYDRLRQAEVRTYVPIPAERRSRQAPAAAGRTADAVWDRP
ncbi:three-helix bundle dimerization domain-containing protein [Streptomyces sp. NPDC054840]